MNRLPSLALPLALAGALLAACTASEDPPAERVFLGPPWTADERFVYDLLASGREPYGTCVLETDVEFEPGVTRLSRLCSDEPGPHRDDGIATVEAQTLEPISSTRVQTDAEKNRRISFTATYAYPVVKFEANDNGKVRQTERDLPRATEKNPDPAYYDDESMLWLVRGIDLQTGYEGTYRNVSAATGAVFDVRLRVEGEEEVTVPAGTFRTWKVRISTSTITQFAWVERDAPHRIIKARVHGLQDVDYVLSGASAP
ncbi:DUF3108 domain-containing protein [Tepidiforma thermophila]|mgnify:CR=1 FL=1|uniref:Uncharacterized protein DUF3108 n=1 Tax=Tepidiforma thermophila (strain KCTC 52669 / CGMCC 1.13589 / G233) TaxID=2761530 RepID=A0A2A9HHL4_TEPT2|nr:DUF3108 domain-containing protein [Tepidiforma thermophila]PFG74446.1 uncharacterized protein DUF3108 [Tepidiforma thermophila]